MGPIDVTVILLYGATVLGIGYFAGRGHQSAEDLTLGRRAVPTWAVMLSMVATELSAATFLGVPDVGYRGDWWYVQFGFGSLLGKIILAYSFIPLYHRLRVVTVYGFMEERFGPGARRASALYFVFGRILASGARLFIAALALSVVLDIDTTLSIVICGILAGTYTLFGGIRAVIWTDTLQGAVFVIAAVSCIVALATKIDGGLGAIFEWAANEGRMQIFHFDPWISWSATKPFFVGLLGGAFLTLATHGTDHDMVQRLLTTKDGRGGRRALIASGLLNFPMTATFLFIGTGLAVFYSANPVEYDLPGQGDNTIFAVFALNELPAGFTGLIFAGLFAAAMSSLDSAICAIATTWVTDVMPRSRDDRETVKRTRLLSAVVSVLLMAAAIGVSYYKRELADADFDLVQLALSSMTIIYGGLLGVFLLAILTKRAGSDRSVVNGLHAGATCGVILFLQPLWVPLLYPDEKVLIAWPWWIVIGAAVSFAGASLGRERQ